MQIPQEDFIPFNKIPRLNRECVVTEKVDGTNGVIFIKAICTNCSGLYRLVQDNDGKVLVAHDGETVTRAEELSCCDKPNIPDKSTWTIHAGSKNRWLTVEDDNYGFAKWIEEHTEELKQLGPGKHHGEWFGTGINRRYKNTPKQFALFNTSKWNEQNPPPKCCTTVPVLYNGPFDTTIINNLRLNNPESKIVKNTPMEGIIVYHIPSGIYFKATCQKDDEWKGKSSQ